MRKSLLTSMYVALIFADAIMLFGCSRPRTISAVRVNEIVETPPASPDDIASLQFQWEMPPETEEQWRKKNGKEPPKIFRIHARDAYCRYHQGTLFWWNASRKEWTEAVPKRFDD